MRNMLALGGCPPPPLARWVQVCNLPLKDLIGFPSPDLVHNPPVREVLAKNNYLYDATILEARIGGWGTCCSATAH